MKTPLDKADIHARRFARVVETVTQGKLDAPTMLVELLDHYGWQTDEAFVNLARFIQEVREVLVLAESYHSQTRMPLERSSCIRAECEVQTQGEQDEDKLG
jgi:hypothetical protein